MSKLFYNVMTAHNHVLGSFETEEEAKNFIEEKLIPGHDCTIIITEDEPAL